MMIKRIIEVTGCRERVARPGSQVKAGTVCTRGMERQRSEREEGREPLAAPSGAQNPHPTFDLPLI